MTRLIWWLRRDLRLHDNTALAAALNAAQTVIPVFILDDALLNADRLRGPRTAWLFDGLRALHADLQQYGSQLVIRHGEPSAELLRLCAETGAAGVYFNRDYSPYAVQRDERVVKALREAGLVARHYADLLIHESGEVLSKNEKPYTVYSPFRKAWEALPKPPLVDVDIARLRPAPNFTFPASTPLPDAPQGLPAPIVPPGERAARERLRTFMAGAVYQYGEGRDFMGIDGTSVLSPYLRWGMISARTCYWAAQDAAERWPHKSTQRESVAKWVSEIVWREFNYHIMTRYPHIIRRNFAPAFDRIQWGNNREWLAAWKAAKTGYPVVDAAMRQLYHTGWMHNRTRMIVASFLCKDLLIDWREGEAVFMRWLLDGDAANNVGGWQWTAGTGTDAAPYFRVFNPIGQSEKFDPNGDYIRRWLPELAALPAKFIHDPSQMTRADQDRYGVILGRDYPLPIVDHNIQREKALAMYSAVKRYEPQGR